jgi:hypothetical protein
VTKDDTKHTSGNNANINGNVIDGNNGVPEPEPETEPRPSASTKVSSKITCTVLTCMLCNKAIYTTCDVLLLVLHVHMCSLILGAFSHIIALCMSMSNTYAFFTTL